MSAAFRFGNYLCWGSNGMVEECLSRMTDAAASLNAGDDLASWLKNRHQSFYNGAVVVLDDIVTDRESATRFANLLEKVSAELLSSGHFNDIGKRWVQEEIPKLKAHILAAP